MQGEPKQGSWKSCLGCFLGGLLFLAGIGGVLFHFRSQSMEKLATMDRVWLQPWVQLVSGHGSDEQWEQLTSPGYRQNNSQQAVMATYQKAIEQWGPPLKVSIFTANGSHQIGEGRSFQHTITSWEFEKGTSLYITYELVDGPSGGYQVDRAAPGARKTILPRDLPSGPW